MPDRPHDGIDLEKAKRIARGPLGDELTRFPIRFATSLLIWGDDGPKTPRDLFNGTATLLRIDQQTIAVTCQHVLSGFHKRRESKHRSSSQIGDLVVDLDAILISEDPALDLAVLDLSSFSVDEAVSKGPAGSGAFEPSRWPPAPVQENEPVFLGGFPGRLRRAIEPNEIISASFSAAGVPVASVSSTQFLVQFEREYWVGSSFDGPYDPEFDDLGGLSGGPVFAQRGLAFDLVGFIKEFSSGFHVLYATPCEFISQDGSISKQN